MRTVITRSLSIAAKDALRVVHDSSNRMFRAFNHGMDCGHLQYKLQRQGSTSVVEFYHTFTKPEVQGRGFAGAMVESGLQWARLNKYMVIPTCSYVAAFMAKNHQWNTLLYIG
jgi:predicted GNAT family acetyltransferase